MEIKELVCSLKPSKELRDLGVEQDSIYSWIEYSHGTFHVELTKDAISLGGKEKGLYSAPTFAELLEVLPDKITSIISKTYGVKKDYYIHILKTKKSSGFVLPDYFVGYKTLDGRYLHSERADTIVDAAGQMVIYLIKEGVIEVKKDV